MSSASIIPLRKIGLFLSAISARIRVRIYQVSVFWFTSKSGANGQLDNDSFALVSRALAKNHLCAVKDCATGYFEGSITIIAMPASYTPYTVFFLAFDTLIQCGQTGFPVQRTRFKWSMRLSWSGKRLNTSIRFIRKMLLWLGCVKFLAAFFG